jgi:hypothetical protein
VIGSRVWEGMDHKANRQITQGHLGKINLKKEAAVRLFRVFW